MIGEEKWVSCPLSPRSSIALGYVVTLLSVCASVYSPLVGRIVLLPKSDQTFYSRTVKMRKLLVSHETQESTKRRTRLNEKDGEGVDR